MAPDLSRYSPIQTRGTCHNFSRPAYPAGGTTGRYFAENSRIRLRQGTVVRYFVAVCRNLGGLGEIGPRSSPPPPKRGFWLK